MSLYSGNGKRLAKRSGAGRSAVGKRLRPPRSHGRTVHGILGLCLAVGGLTLCAWLAPWEHAVPQPPAQSGGNMASQIPELRPAPEEPAWSPDPLPESAQTPEQETDRYVLSFAGDCTLGTEHGRWGVSGTFPAVVGTDYAYPLSGVKALFEGDDFTFVNLECALTDHTVPAEKTFRFRGPPAYGQILKEGSVEGVTLANNHSLDYGETGLADTRRTLEELGIAAGGDGETFLYTTQRGLKVGVYTAYHIGRTGIRTGIEALQAQGAEVIIAAFHSGTEGAYAPTDQQRALFRYAADCGADIVYNSHPHVLQPIETYGESVIFYSLGNFCYGGNRNPTDKDTVVIQVTAERQMDGSVCLTGVTAYPCCVSSRSDGNDYRPTLYPADSAQAARVERKLAGTYRPPAQSLPASAAPSASAAGEEERSGPAESAAVPKTEPTWTPLPDGGEEPRQDSGESVDTPAPEENTPSADASAEGVFCAAGQESSLAATSAK